MDTTHFKKFWTLLKDVEENTPFEYKVDKGQPVNSIVCESVSVGTKYASPSLPGAP